MNIGLDTEFLAVALNRGIGNYILGLYNALFRLDHENHFFLLEWDELSVKELFDFSSNVTICHMNSYEKGNVEQYRKIIQTCVERYKLDVFYNPHVLNLASWTIDLKKEWFPNTKLTGTVHDIIPFLLKNQYLVNVEQLENCIIHCENMSEYDLLFANSETTKVDVQREFEIDRIVNIYMASQKKDVKISNNWEEYSAYLGIRNKYFLSVGGFTCNKNYPRLVRAYIDYLEKSNEKYQLVLTGPMPDKVKENIYTYAKSKNVLDSLILTGFVTDEELELLYQNAAWMVFPSLYEGFGMPVVEAWEHGIPVITSNNSSVYEISEDAAIHVKPDDVESIAKGMLLAENMPENERKEYIAKGQKRLELFSWDKTAEMWLENVKGLFNE